MLTRLKLKRGEGNMVGSPEVGSSGRRARFPKSFTLIHPQFSKVAVESLETMSHEGEPTMTEDEKTFRKDFFDMTDMMKVLYEEKNSRLQGESYKPPKGEGYSGGGDGKGGNGNGDKPPPYPPSSSSSTSQESSQSSTKTTVTHTLHHSSIGIGKSPFLKLDVKFELPMYNGEVNAEKLDNWIRQLEVYCRIQNLQEDDIKIHLDSLRMEGATLVWWESKTQDKIKKHGKISITWSNFIISIKIQFYPLTHM